MLLTKSISYKSVHLTYFWLLFAQCPSAETLSFCIKCKNLGVNVSSLPYIYVNGILSVVHLQLDMVLYKSILHSVGFTFT